MWRPGASVVGDYKIPRECHRHVPIDHLEMAFGITRVTPVTGAILHARDGRVGQVPAVGSERFCTTSRTATVLLMHALHEHSFPGLELATQKASQSTRSSESLHIEPSQALNFFQDVSNSLSYFLSSTKCCIFIK